MATSKYTLRSLPKVQAVLSTRRALKSDNGVLIPSSTRVVVSSLPDGRVRARTADGEFVTSTPKNFAMRFRGRPRHDGKLVTLVKQASLVPTA
jgi:hypothetical protein